MPYRHSEGQNLYAQFYQVRRKLNETTASYWVDLEIYNWLNEAQQYIVRKSKCLKKTVTVTTDGSQEYDLKDNSFADIIDISEDGVYFYQNGSTYQKLNYTTKWKLDRESPGWRGVAASTPTDYYYNKSSKTIGLYPKCNSSNQGAYLFVGGYYRPVILHAGTAAAGAATTLTLAAGSSTAPYPSTVDDYYNNVWLEIYSGTGVAEKAEITDYTGSSKLCTVNFTSTPTTTSIYGMISQTPEEAHHLMVLYAVAKAWEKGGSRTQLANNYWSQFYNGLNLFIGETIEDEDEDLVRESYR